MCERYKLRFYHELGIIAWADDDLFETFTGDLMEGGDLWQICLGRRIQLDPDDFDGEDFMRGLIEESCLFPNAVTTEHGAWQTVLTRQGRKKRRVWVTRLTLASQDVLSDSGSDGASEVADELAHAGEDAVSVDELDIDPYAPPATLFINEYEDETDSEDDDAGTCSQSSASEAGEASEMVLRDAAWDSDAFFQGYSSSDDSEVDLELGDPNDPEE
ncbi:hypothetical protein PENSPDRAFT_314079 [Peniophora sp. CONT]|nr:hypothetical protein PENSPDRAFT_314079 [Peniophora sp. CONT]